MKLSVSTILLIFLLFFFSCKKNNSNNSTVQDKPGSIDITSPATGVSYDNGTVVKTEGTVIDENGIISVKIEIRNKTSGAVFFQQTTSTANVTVYPFLWNWIVTGVTTTTQATVKVTATDQLNKQVFKEVDITLRN